MRATIRVRFSRKDLCFVILEPAAFVDNEASPGLFFWLVVRPVWLNTRGSDCGIRWPL